MRPEDCFVFGRGWIPLRVGWGVSGGGMQMSKSGISFLWAGDQKKEAHTVLGLDDLIRLLPSCLL